MFSSNDLCAYPSPIDFGTDLDRIGRLNICISMRLTKLEMKYFQTQSEALEAHCAAKRQLRFLFGMKCTIVIVTALHFLQWCDLPFFKIYILGNRELTK